MDKVATICFSSDKNYLNRLVTETEIYFGNSLVENRFRSREDLLQFLESILLKKEIHFILLHIPEADKATLQFLNTVNRLSPSSIKLILGKSENFVPVQEQINNPDSFKFINRPVSENDFKIAFTTAKICYPSLQTILKYKEERNHYNIEKEKHFSTIAHDLKSPFTALLGISEILISDWGELSDTDKLELVKGIKSTSENAYQMLEKLSIQHNRSILK
jgi:signal transduction histidine kinase